GEKTSSQSYNPGTYGSGTATTGAGTGATSSTLVNINTASMQELDDKLPGIGPAYAQRIVDYRQQHGGFKSIEELKEVSGIGEKRFQQMKDMVCL
ncbi:MAG: ComEA family DNA-binding protein, partial [Chitinophagales bacterium]